MHTRVTNICTCESDFLYRTTSTSTERGLSTCLTPLSGVIDGSRLERRSVMNFVHVTKTVWPTDNKLMKSESGTLLSFPNIGRSMKSASVPFLNFMLTVGFPVES